jgi:hypothetical protein
MRDHCEVDEIQRESERLIREIDQALAQSEDDAKQRRIDRELEAISREIRFAGRIQPREFKPTPRPTRWV